MGRGRPPGRLFNAHYFLYFAVAVTEYWRTIGLEYPERYIERAGADLYAVKASAEFNGSARYDDVLDLGAAWAGSCAPRRSSSSASGA